MDELLLNLGTLRLAEPWWLLLFPLMALLGLAVKSLRRSRPPAIVYPGVRELQRLGFSVNPLLSASPLWLRRAAIALSVLALCRPMASLPGSYGQTSGIDIILALDISESMQQKDFQGNSRLQAARSVAREFIGQRSRDRIGLVVFSGKSFTQCPLTLDHEVLGMLVDGLSGSSINESGTAIGTAILTATNRLKASESKEKALVLLTDGENNTGEIGPVTAARLAVQRGIRIYTILAAPKEAVSSGALPSGSAADSLAARNRGRAELEEISRISGGRSFSVADYSGLQQTFRNIDRMEKNRLQGRNPARKADLFPWLLLPAFLLLSAELALSNIRLIRIP